MKVDVRFYPQEDGQLGMKIGVTEEGKPSWSDVQVRDADGSWKTIGRAEQPDTITQFGFFFDPMNPPAYLPVEELTVE